MYLYAGKTTFAGPFQCADEAANTGHAAYSWNGVGRPVLSGAEGMVVEDITEPEVRETDKGQRAKDNELRES